MNKINKITNELLKEKNKVKEDYEMMVDTTNNMSSIIYGLQDYDSHTTYGRRIKRECEKLLYKINSLLTEFRTEYREIVE